MVELVALRYGRDKPLQLGLLAGVGIGTVGLAAEWAWSYAWWTISWPSDMLVEGVICGFVAAVAGGVTGGFVGRALGSPEIAPEPVPRFALPAALIAVVAVVAYATPVTAGDPIRADVTLTDAKPAPKREVNVQVKLDPADGADGAYWFETTAWQGKEGRSPVAAMEEVSPGTWRSTEPVPVYGDWKTTLRLHKGLGDPGPGDLLPRGQGDPGQGRPGRAALHALLPARQETAAARAEVRRLTGAERLRLPGRAGDLPRALRLDGLGPGAAAAAASHASSSRLTAAGPSGRARGAARCLPLPERREGAVELRRDEPGAEDRVLAERVLEGGGDPRVLVPLLEPAVELAAPAALGLGVRLRRWPAWGAPTPVSVIHTTCFFGHLWVAAARASSRRG